MTSRTQKIAILGTTAVAGLAGPPLAAFSRGGLEQLLAPPTLASWAITFGFFYSVSQVWSRVAEPDERREALEEAVREAARRFYRVIEDGSAALSGLQEDADHEIVVKAAEIEEAFANAPEAVTHLEIEIPRYKEAWRGDQEIAEGAIAEGFDALHQLVSGRGIELPQHLLGRPDLSPDWETLHAIATTDWRKLLNDRRDDIEKMRVEVPKSRSRIQQAYDDSLAEFDAVVERLRGKLRFNIMNDAAPALPNSQS